MLPGYYKASKGKWGSVGAQFALPHLRLGCFLRRAVLSVVLLTIDRAALAIELAVKPFAFTKADVAIRSSESFVHSNSCHSRFEPLGFAPRKLAASDALIDSSLFSVLAPVNVSALTREGHRAHAEYKQRGDKKADYSLHTAHLFLIESRHPSYVT